MKSKRDINVLKLVLTASVISGQNVTFTSDDCMAIIDEMAWLEAVARAWAKDGVQIMAEVNEAVHNDDMAEKQEQRMLKDGLG